MTYIVKRATVNNALEKAIGFGFDKYSMTRIGLDSSLPPLIHRYLNSLVYLLDNHGLKFADCRFLRPASDNFGVSSSRVFIIGENSQNQNNYLVELINQCPGGPILEEVKKELCGDDESIQREINPLFKKSKEYGEKILTILDGPGVYSRENLMKIQNLFVSDNEEFSRDIGD